MSRTLGILGGTFDPIHLGHLDAASAARSALSLGDVLFVPASDPPHRPVDPRASAFHRFAMAALATRDIDGCRLSDVELRRGGPSYTALTLRDLHAAGWTPSQLFFILGADAFAEIATWHDYPDILDAANFAVIARPGTSPAAALTRTPTLLPRVRAITDIRGPGASTGIVLVEARTSPASSSEIRSRLSTGQSLNGLVPAPVARYIHLHNLYSSVDDLHGQD